MKKISIILAIAMVAGVASAGLVWENNFNSPQTFFDPPVNPVDMHSGREDAWLGAGTASTNVAQQLLLQSGGGGQARGLVRALDADNHAAQVDTTGDATFYRFTFDIIDIYGATDLNIQFLHGTRDDDGSNPEANSYGIDLLSALGGDLTHTTIGAGSLTSIFDVTYTTADDGTSKTIDFEYDGTGDLVMVFDVTGNDAAAWTRNALMDNMSLSVIPEPATLGLVGIVGGALLALRRRFIL